jgi:hypothetical protein
MKKVLSSFCLLSLLISSAFAWDEYTIKSPLEAANFLAAKGFIADKTANPDEYRLLDNIERKEVIKVVMKLSGKNVPDECNWEFDDVANDWSCKYIEAALREWYIAPNDNFRPTDKITLTEAMKLVLKAKGIDKTQETDAWQEDYMMTAYEYRIIEEKYYEFNANAIRGWIFQITTATIEKEEKIKEIIEEKEKLMSDEAM